MILQFIYETQLTQFAYVLKPSGHDQATITILLLKLGSELCQRKTGKRSGRVIILEKTGLGSRTNCLALLAFKCWLASCTIEKTRLRNNCASAKENQTDKNLPRQLMAESRLSVAKHSWHNPLKKSWREGGRGKGIYIAEGRSCSDLWVILVNSFLVANCFNVCSCIEQ